MGTMNKDIELQSFFIFSSLFGSEEGQEYQKILYYYPPTDDPGVQIQSVGLVEGIVQFTRTFNPTSSVSSLHTNKLRQLYFQPEANFWVVMSLTLPVVTKVKENISSLEYLEDDLQDNVYEAVLKQIYFTYRLFWGTFEATLAKSDLETLKTRTKQFFNPYLASLNVADSDILNTFGGIQYLPLDRQTFLKIQCFVNSLESKWNCIAHTVFLYNDHAIWSGIEPNDMQMVYQYLTRTLLPIHINSEFQGVQLRNVQAPFTSLRRGRFITGPASTGQPKTIADMPKIYLYSDAQVNEYHLLVYISLNATVCLFVKGETELSLQDYSNLDTFINPRISSIANDIAEYCSKQVVSPSTVSETSPKFIYFNKINLAYKSTVQLDNKQTNIACTRDSLRIMADMKRTNCFLGLAGENIVKTTNDYWVFSKTSNLREFYIVLQQKNASLIGISEDVKRLCESELDGIFFHPM